MGTQERLSGRAAEDETAEAAAPESSAAADDFSSPTPLSIPELPDDIDAMGAALAYAKAGWYVLPVAKDTKNPGSVVGRRWQDQSSRDPKQIVAWFAGTDHGVALHCGRSGAVVSDVDHFDQVPEVLAKHLPGVPYQSSRPDEEGRGHYVFAQPVGRTIGNGLGRLGRGWGEVRGLNGVIVVAPTEHPDGGLYQWMRTGPVPALPAEIADLLTDANPAQDAASDAEIAAFLAEYTATTKPHLLNYIVGKLTAELASGGSRHEAAVRLLPWALRESRCGYYPAHKAVEQLGVLFQAAVVDKPGGSGKVRTAVAATNEWRGIVAWSVGQARAASEDDLNAIRARVESPTPGMASPEVDSDDPADPHRIDTTEFWSARPELEHIQTVARTRMISKWALLGVALAQSLASTPPHVVLPPGVGSVGSLNSIVALVGPSNSGKNTAVDVEAETIHRDGNQPPVLPVGSGEGIVCTFRPRGTKPDAPNAIDRAVFTAMEVDTLTAVSGRQGSTLSPVLRELFNGALLGFANAGRDTRVVVEAHSYRASVILGVQPLRSKDLLGEAAGGLPQRILWMPAWDPSLQDVPPARVQTWSVPPLSLDMFAGQHQMCVPDSVVAEIRRDRLRAARGLDQGDRLDGHSNFVRLKVAAALAIHAGRADINEEDWQLAGVIMAISKATRTMCLDELSRQRRGSNHARAMDAAYRDEVNADHKHQRALKGIRRHLADDQPHDGSDLRRGLKVDIRDCFDAAITELIDSGEVTHRVDMRRNRPVRVYQRYTPKKHTATSGDETCTESTRVPTPADVAARTGPRQRQRTRGKNRREHSAPAESD